LCSVYSDSCVVQGRGWKRFTAFFTNEKKLKQSVFGWNSIHLIVALSELLLLYIVFSYSTILRNYGHSKSNQILRNVLVFVGDSFLALAIFLRNGCM
jgi:hypothetical protein